MKEKRKPKIDGRAVVFPQAVVQGDVTVGADSSVWYHAVVRGDVQSIVIGEGTNIQDGAILHVDRNFPLRIGDRVTVGHGAILHGCTVGNHVLVGMGAIVMNGAVVGDGSIVGAGALVTQGTVVPENSLVMGSPARVRREVSPEEVKHNIQNAENYIRESKDADKEVEN